MKHQILSLTCLPIPPYPHGWDKDTNKPREKSKLACIFSEAKYPRRSRRTIKPRTKQILFAITEAEYYLPAATLRRYVAPRGPKPPPAEARHCGRAPQTSTRRYGAADLRIGILPEEPISSVVYFFLLCFWLDPKAPKDQARRKVAGDDTRAR